MPVTFAVWQGWRAFCVPKRSFVYIMDDPARRRDFGEPMSQGSARRLSIFRADTRPMPPDGMLADLSAEEFEPARDLMEWARRTLLDPKSRIYNPDHEHLEDAEIGMLWTNVAYRKQMRQIAGTAEIPHVQGPVWTKKRVDWQLRQWFGEIPNFLITVDAPYAAQCDDAAFCALVDHELTHCGIARDEFGEPRYRQDGTPIWAIVGHDVEEFVSIVRRWGVGSAAGKTRELVEAANAAPLIAAADISRVCGACR
jgi:hypothetical protein